MPRLDLEGRRPGVTCGVRGGECNLTPQEIELLRLLYRHIGRISRMPRSEMAVPNLVLQSRRTRFLAHLQKRARACSSACARRPSGSTAVGPASAMTTWRRLPAKAFGQSEGVSRAVSISARPFDAMAEGLRSARSIHGNVIMEVFSSLHCSPDSTVLLRAGGTTAVTDFRSVFRQCVFRRRRTPVSRLRNWRWSW